MKLTAKIIPALTSGTVWLLFLIIVAVSSLCAGVFLLSGLAWALIALSGSSFLFAFIILRGLAGD